MKYTVKLIFSVSFYFLKMWSLGKRKLHMWLTLYIGQWNQGEKTLRQFPDRQGLVAGTTCLEKSENRNWSCSNHAEPWSPTVTFLCFLRTMAHLYGDPEWSQKDLKGPISHVREHLAKSKLEAFSPECLASYHRELAQRAEQGHTTTFVDLWGLVLEFMLHGQVGHLCVWGGRCVHRWGGGSPAASWGPCAFPVGKERPVHCSRIWEEPYLCTSVSANSGMLTFWVRLFFN